jgi:hypothetical protein
MDSIRQRRFLPLALPKFEYKQQVLEAFDGSIKFGYWHEEELTERDRSKPFNDPMSFTQEAVAKYPELIEYITTQWPFEYFVYVKLIRANRNVDPHVDGNFVDDKGPVGNYNTITQEYLDHQIATEPCGYRMILNGNRSSLYLCDTYDPTYKQKDWSDINKQFCAIPEDTDCFVLRTNDSPHGVDYIEDDNQRLLLFAVGQLDVDKHNELLNRSVQKYG